MIHIQQVQFEELKSLIAIHARALPDDVLPNIGQGAINRYYQKIFEFQNTGKASVYGAYDGDRLIGFCCITGDSPGIQEIIRLDTIACLVVLLITRPRLVISAFLQLAHLVPMDETGMEIEYIALDSDYRGRGVGSLLIQYCIEESRKKNYVSMQTKTSNERLFNYYMNNLGATLIKEFNVLGKIYRVVKWRT
jgi:ribosomal protein S18 acetylase RimI-like enzyme